MTNRRRDSFRGEAGLLVCHIFVVSAVSTELVLAGGSAFSAIGRLGLQRPETNTAAMALLLCLGLIAGLIAAVLVLGAVLSLMPSAPVLALGMFAQGGIAEEMLFRGFLFRRLREIRSYWHAAGLAALPFMAVHGLMFLSLEPAIATASLIVSHSLTFPLARLFELSGGSIWPCTLVHAAIQIPLKVLEPTQSFQDLALVWMLISSTVPWCSPHRECPALPSGPRHGAI